MLNLAKYAAIAALAVGLGIAATKPVSAWDYTWWGFSGWGYSCGDGCGYGYGAFGPFPYGPYPYGYDGTPVRGQAQAELPAKAQASSAPGHVRSCARAGCGKSAPPVR
jgi:hypothetical protein